MLHALAGSDEADVSGLHVEAEELMAVVAMARGIGEIVSLRELVDRHQTGRATNGLFALTFDDAYASLLDEAGGFVVGDTPATIFVVADAAETAGSFWWDRLERLIAIDDPEVWQRIRAAAGLPDAAIDGAARRLEAVRGRILAHHRGRCPPTLDAEFGRLEDELSLDPGQRSMTFQEIARLVDRSPVDVGVHTRTHPVLPMLSDEDMRLEIAGAHQTLGERLGDVLPILAVPFGLADRRTVRTARSLGLNCSLGLRGTTLARHSDHEELQRICVMRHQPRWKLSLRMRGWIERIDALIGRLPPRYPSIPA